MKINSLTIDGIGGIKHLDLKFNDKMNVICGANGIGKSTILNIIADAFNAGISSNLKKMLYLQKGNISLK
ncbi:AAA family ATPase [Megamonas funiformis]|uniref:AAA family ATPase n=1 Tax=Megamonas funiformis TaxID=437897 RepID=UPI0026DC7851|nr:AAA family ATPase [Megamonas funiformis]